MKGSAETVLMWEGKDFVAADADAADAAETNWKHKVTPDRGDLMIDFCGTAGNSIGQASNVCGWLCKEAVKVSIKMAATWQRPMDTWQESHHNIDVNKWSTVAPVLVATNHLTGVCKYITFRCAVKDYG